MIFLDGVKVPLHTMGSVGGGQQCIQPSTYVHPQTLPVAAPMRASFGNAKRSYMPSGSEHLGEHLCRTQEKASCGEKGIDFGISQAYIEFLLHCLPDMGSVTIYSDLLSIYFFNLLLGIIMPTYTVSLI